MRILMISKACVVAPYRSKLEELARLPEVELFVIVPPYWRTGKVRQSLEPGADRGYQLIVASMALNGSFHLHFYPALSRHMRRIRPDIVHIDEEPYNLATSLAMRAARRSGAMALFFTWQNLSRRYPPPFGAMERCCYQRTDYALAGNAEAAEVLRAKGYAGPVEIIPQFGVDPDVYRPGETDRNPNRPFTIGYAGRLVPEKGVDLLLRAAASLEGDWRIEILGQGPERKALGLLTSRLGIADRVSFRGSAPAGKVPDFLSHLDVLVLPSRSQANWKEQFGRVLVEAMACQVPVIGSSCGEIPNVIGEGGLVFAEGDVASLRQRLLEMRGEPNRVVRWGMPGRARVLANYTQARIAAETYRVYRRMLGGSPNAL